MCALALGAEAFLHALFPRLWRRPPPLRLFLVAVARGVALGFLMERWRRHAERLDAAAPQEARRLLADQVTAIRERPYAEHAARIPARGGFGGLFPPERVEIRRLSAPSGERYDVRLTTRWVARPGGEVEVELLVIDASFASVVRETVRLSPGGR